MAAHPIVFLETSPVYLWQFGHIAPELWLLLLLFPTMMIGWGVWVCWGGGGGG
jgi:hypothetical protein